MDPEVIKDKTRKTYNEVGPEYDSWYWFKKARELRAGLRKRVLEVLDSKIDKKVKILELCSGTGYLVEELSKRGEYSGLDFAPRMISHCEEKHPQCKFVLAEAEEIPFKESSFDVVICFWSFHHIVYPENVLSEIKRVLKPNGVVIIATFKDVRFNLAAKLGDIMSSRYWGFVTKRYSPKAMRALMEPRFKNVDIEIYPESKKLLDLLGIRFIVASGRK